jgi:hypothetical protein
VLDIRQLPEGAIGWDELDGNLRPGERSGLGRGARRVVRDPLPHDGFTARIGDPHLELAGVGVRPREPERVRMIFRKIPGEARAAFNSAGMSFTRSEQTSKSPLSCRRSAQGRSEQADTAKVTTNAAPTSSREMRTSL